MNKYVKSENGNTLMIVLGFVIVLSLVIAPLALRTTTGLLQAQSGGLKEAAYSDAYSAMTLFAKLYEEVKSETESSFGGLGSHEEWIELLDGRISGIVASRYPNVDIQRTGDGENAEWIFAARQGPTVVNYENSGPYYRSGQVVFSLKEGASGGGSANPLPTLPPDTGDGGGDGGGGAPPTMPMGGKIMLKASGVDREKQYNKMFAACRIQGSGEQASGNTAQALVPEELYFDNRHDEQRAGTPEDPKFDQAYGAFLDYYTDINARVDSFPFYAGSKKGSDDPRLATAKDINRDNLTGSPLSVPAAAWPASWDGNVEVNGKMNDSSVRTHEFTERVFVGNNLVFKPKQNETLNVDVKINAPASSHGLAVGGNLAFEGTGNNARLIIGHGVFVRGNFTASGSNNWEVLIKGDLVVGGNFTLNVNSFKSFVVEGDIIVGGNAVIEASGSTSGTVGIKGSLQAGGNVTIAAYPVIDIGKDLLSGGNTVFTTRLERTISIGRNFAAKGHILMQGSNGQGNLAVGHHMLSNGNIQLTNGTELNSKIMVGGTLAAAGDVYAGRTVNGNGMLVVKDNIIVGRNFGLTQSTGDSMDGKLLMETANLIVFGDANFGKNLNGGYKRLLVQGIAVKGFVAFDNNDYNNNNSADRAAICVTGVAVS